MNYFCDSGGEIFHVDPERVFQGSANANVINFFGAFPHNCEVLIAYELPDGTWTTPKRMTPIAELTGAKDKDGNTYAVWQTRIGAVLRLEDGVPVKDENGEYVYDLDYTITEHYGTVNVQFYVYANAGNGNGVQIATASSSFIVSKGVPIVLPDTPTDDYEQLLAQILSAVADKNGDIDKNANDISELKEDVAELKESGGGGSSENAIPVTEKGQPNGVATLGADGKVPAEQLPEMGGGGETPGLSEYVKKTDYATSTVAGVVKFDNSQGIGVNGGVPFIFYAQQSDIEKKTSYRYPITPIVLDYAVKVGLTTNTETLTDEEKASACDWLGAVKVEENTTSVPYVYTDDKNHKHYLGHTESSYIVRNIPMIFGNAAGNNKPSNGYLLTNDPVNPYHCANKQYVDNAVVKLYKHILNTSFGEITLVSYSPEVKTERQLNSNYDPEYPDEQPEYFEVFVIPQYIFGYCANSRVVAIDYVIDEIYIAMISSIGFIQETEINIVSYRVEEYNGGDI